MRKIGALIALVLVVLPACASSPKTTSNEIDTGSATSSAPTERPGGSSNGSADRWTGPDFTVETFDGNTFTLAEQAGSPVVLNFWESW